VSNPRKSCFGLRRLLVRAGSAKPLTVFILVLTASVSMAMSVGIASGDDHSHPAGAASSAPSVSPIRELPGRRSATSNTFLLTNGQLETRLYELPVNYRDQDGKWKPIGEGLTELPGGALTNGANSFDVRLPRDLDEAPVRVTLGDELVSEMPVGVETGAANLGQDGTASYTAAGGSADFQFDGLANGLKESIELSGPAAPSSYRFRIEASPGVVPSLAADGAIAFRQQDGTFVAEMPPPSMVDEAGAQAPASAIHYSLAENGEGRWDLAVEADAEWLQAEDRSWPVVIDPTVKVPSPALDCIVATTTENQMCGTAGYSYLTSKADYPSAGEDTFARTLLRFSLTPSIPANAYLTSSSIGLYSAKTATNITRVDMYDVSRTWEGGATWRFWGNDHHTHPDKEWVNKGGDYGKYLPTPASLTPAERGGSGAGWWTFSSPDLTWLAQRWLEGAVPNNGVLLKLADETPRVCCFERRVEWESSAGTNKPYLSVQYIEPASSDSKITSPSDGTKSARRFLLTSAWEHSGVSGVTFQYKTNLGWRDIPAGQVINEKNQTVTWPVGVEAADRETKPLYWDASSLTGTNTTAKLQIRALLSGSVGAGGYTKPVSAEINKDTGGPKDATAPIGPGNVNLLTGNFSISRTDLSIPAFNSTLEFSRSFNSREAEVESTGVLGPGWKPASPVEEAGGSSWTKLVLKEETEEFEEGGTFTYKWAELSHSEGGVLAFEDNGSGQYITPPEMSGYVLYRNPTTGNIEFTDPEGNRTVFSNFGSGNEYSPISVAMTGGPGNKSRMIYEFVGGKRRLWKVIAPSAPGVSCPDEGSSVVNGCRLLVFTYQSATTWGAPESAGARLSKITYYASGHGGPWDVAQYSYNTKGQLAAAWDPRITPNLKETYTYLTKGQLGIITPPGESAWLMGYMADEGMVRGRLKSVRRASLVESNPTAWTTIAYNVPLTGSSAPFSMGGEAVSAWDQKDVPTDATAIFPPDEIPAETPTSYTRATVYYMDAEGQLSNVATESGAGTSAPSITTSEADRFGNVLRELSPQNRLRALAAGVGAPSIARSREIDSRYVYSKDGTEMQEEKGPMHQVRLESGTTTQARMHRAIQYDKGAPVPAAGESKPHMPTTETTGALLSNGSVVDKRSTEYRYNWTLRKRTESIFDPEGSEETKSITLYDGTTGMPTEMRQPSNASGGGAGTTKIVYYTYKNNNPSAELCETNLYAGLACRIEPAAQPGTLGQPQLPVKKIRSYNQLDEPLEVTESPGGGAENVRKTLTTYDAAGRPKTSEVIGGGVAVPKVETLYSGSIGMPTTQRIVCPESEPTCDTQATTATYDSLGRVTSYLDADGVTAKTTYDFLGRPATSSDGKGTQTMKYDSVTGLLVELEDSAAGTFTASYDADGQIVKRGFPNGLTSEASYDETGDPSGLTYTKASNCGLSCNWLDFAVERSINGQILVENGTLGKDEYGYDKLGRLTVAREIPSGGTCTTRSYTYDKDSNRKEKTTTPGIGGTCSSSGGTTQKYSYDAADRLLGEGLTYDSFGRITNLPGAFAGGKALATTYFSNDMVATQSQNGVTNSFQLDALLRQRQRLQAGGLEGTEVFHYAGPGDTPTWTQRGTFWSRSIAGIGGELVALQESGKEIELQLTNLHGDVLATAAINPLATELKGTFGYDEFGNQTSAGPGRFGWLGGLQRRTELPSGVIQMGARSYVPQLGRFLSPDPVFRGSANPYDYAGQDPINNLDVLGEKYCNKVHGHEVCAGTASRLKKEVQRYREQYRRELVTAKQMAHHHPSFVVRCDCKTQKDRSIFEDFVSKLTGFVKGGVSSYKGSYAVITGDGFKAAWKNAKVASKWGPERLIQSWQCGTWLGGGKGSAGDCDPVEILMGPPDKAR
jgi:RHS repeat-associated protein